MASLFEKDMTELKSVGEKRAKLFLKLGVTSAGALLRFYPRDYEDWSTVTSVGDSVLNEETTVRAQVTAPVTETRIRSGMTLYKVKVTDGERDMLLTFFNNKYIKYLLVEGKTYLFHGKITGTFLKREMTVPEFVPDGDCPPIFPVYPQTEGLSSRMISKAVKEVFLMLPDQLRDPLPKALRARRELCELRFALENIHFPRDWNALETAKRRLVFEELFTLQLGMMWIRNRKTKETSVFVDASYAAEFYKLLPFVPTRAQQRAISEAAADMAGKYPMSRLLQGDVGSGKTAVAAALCYMAAKSGAQSALMAPTEILAVQHYHSLSALLEKGNVRVGLLTGAVKGKERKKLLSDLAEGRIDLIIGTHALLSENVVFSRLGLIVTDEQHRFGVAQRAALSEKGDAPHMLVMSATPIPRTLALMLYGELDLSILDEKPAGRQEIETYCIDSAKRQRAFGYVKKHIDRGYQAYIICPLVEEGISEMASVSEYVDMLKKQSVFAGCRIGMLHGQMKPKEKDEIMQSFSAGETDILVSTTVVEVGVDVPNAVIMMIENAERYGLSQLHQLRGRVGRGKVKSTCILVSDAQNPEAAARLSVMCHTTDGFKIADEDLRLRGPGDFFGSRQHGLPELQIADLHADMEVLKTAQEEAAQLLSEDPTLTKQEHRGLNAQIKALFQKFGDTGLN